MKDLNGRWPAPVAISKDHFGEQRVINMKLKITV